MIRRLWLRLWLRLTRRPLEEPEPTERWFGWTSPAFEEEAWSLELGEDPPVSDAWPDPDMHWLGGWIDLGTAGGSYQISSELGVEPGPEE